MKSRSRKNKGKLLQNWTRKILLSLFEDLEEDDIKSTTMGESGEDIQLSPAARRQIPLSFECKNVKSIAVYKWMDQAESNCPKQCEPVVIAKADRRKPIAIVDAEHYLTLIADNKKLLEEMDDILTKERQTNGS